MLLAQLIEGYQWILIILLIALIAAFVVIRKKQVQGEQMVEADLKKERVDVDRKGDVRKHH